MRTVAFDCTVSVETDLDHGNDRLSEAMSTNTHNLEPCIKAVDEINPTRIDLRDGGFFTENRWLVGRKIHPRILDKFFGINELAVVTHVSWNDDAVENTWTMDLETVDYFNVSGTVNFYEKNGDDILAMTINIQAESVPMLTGFLEGTAVSTVKVTL